MVEGLKTRPVKGGFKEVPEFVGALKYDESNRRWIFTQEKIELPDLKLDKLTFVTWNIWFEMHNFDLRGIEIRDTLSKLDPDFICLQEVITPFFNALCDCDWVRKKYSISGFGKFSNSYECVILSKYPCNFYKTPFPTRMGRSLKFAELMINGQKIAVSTVHLESLNNPDYRARQMQISFDILRTYDEAFIMGDFNFDWDSENSKIPKDFEDVWLKLHTKEEEGFTMEAKGKLRAWRPDRILLKNSKLITPRSIERIGMEPIALYRDNPGLLRQGIITPSDHFGLLATFDFAATSTSKIVIMWADPAVLSTENGKVREQISEAFKSQAEVLFEKNFEMVEKVITGQNEGRYIVILNSTFSAELLNKHKSAMKNFVMELGNSLVVYTKISKSDSMKELYKSAGIEKFEIATMNDQVIKVVNKLLLKE